MSAGYWKKKDIAHYFDVSVQAVDGWIARGCPVERTEGGKLAGMYVGDVIEWGLESNSGESRRRFELKLYDQIAHSYFGIAEGAWDDNIRVIMEETQLSLPAAKKLTKKLMDRQSKAIYEVLGRPERESTFFKFAWRDFLRNHWDSKSKSLKKLAP